MIKKTPRMIMGALGAAILVAGIIFMLSTFHASQRNEPDPEGTDTGAIASFVAQASSNVDKWYRKHEYEVADQLFAAGEFYQAYERFSGLGDYEDAAVRAKACMQSLPNTGELYRQGGFPISSLELTFSAENMKVSYYITIYKGETLVLTLFVRAGQTTKTSIPAGDYTITYASGETWFGENDMFGPEGTYEDLQFNEAVETVHLEDNTSYEISFYTPEIIDPSGHPLPLIF